MDRQCKHILELIHGGAVQGIMCFASPLLLSHVTIIKSVT